MFSYMLGKRDVHRCIIWNASWPTKMIFLITNLPKVNKDTNAKFVLSLSKLISQWYSILSHSMISGIFHHPITKNGKSLYFRLSKNNWPRPRASWRKHSFCSIEHSEQNKKFSRNIFGQSNYLKSQTNSISRTKSFNIDKETIRHVE